MEKRTESPFLLQPEQLVFDETLCLCLRHTVLEKHKDLPVPAYYFHVLRQQDGADMGWLDLRAGHSEETAVYGHLSYCLARPYRGRGYMTRAVSMLLPLAKAHGLRYLYINCAADNFSSQGVCRKLGACLDAEVPQPDGKTCLRFRLAL